MYLGISTDTEWRAINTHNCRCCATYQCPGVSQSSYASFPLHKNSVHSNHTRSDILQVYTVAFAAMAYSSCTTSSPFGRLSEAILQQKPPIPLCQSQTYILLGLNHQQPLWVSHHRYTKEPPLTPLFHG